MDELNSLRMFSCVFGVPSIAESYAFCPPPSALHAPLLVPVVPPSSYQLMSWGNSSRVSFVKPRSNSKMEK